MLTLKQTTMLGEIPHDWKHALLRQLLTGHFPGDWGDERGTNMVRVLRSTNLTNGGRLSLDDVAVRSLNPKTSALLAPKEKDILLERSGGGPDQPVGRVGFVETDMPGHAFSNFLQLLRPDAKKIDPRFLGWVLFWINRTGRILRLEQQTTQMRNLNFRDYLTMPLPVPPPDTQTAISQILDSADAAIHRIREVIERARDTKRSLVQQLFTHGTRGEEQRKTSIGWIPKSWMVTEVKSVVSEFQYGLSVPMQLTGDLPILRMGNIQAGDVLLTDLKYITLPKKITAPCMLNRGDVLFNRTNSQELVGKIGIYRSNEPSVFASYLIRLRHSPELVDGYYLGQILDSHDAQCRIKRYATPGVQQVNINAKNLGKVLIPLPSGRSGLEEQKEIATILEQADKTIRALSPKLKALEALKYALMHDLLTGRVDIHRGTLQPTEVA
jgi:type I restriction enzyme, S subunit